MFSALMSLFKGTQGHLRIYVNGIEIDKIEPRLAFLDLDDWMTPFLKYVFEERSDWGKDFYLVTDKDPKKDKSAPIKSIWFGPVPGEIKKKGYWTAATYEGKKEGDEQPSNTAEIRP